MADRLTRIYTRSGDRGLTGLADGRRVAKDTARIELLGELDELNSRLGLLLSALDDPELAACLSEIQQILFDLGGDLSLPGRNSLTAAQTRWLEGWIDHYNRQLPPLREFILPGGSTPAARAHLVRTATRTAERRAVRLHHEEQLASEALEFLNRLSDYFFVVCRKISRETGGEPQWQPMRPAPRAAPDD